MVPEGGELSARKALPAAGLLALLVAAYLPALSAGFVFDDANYVYKNPLLESWAGLKGIWLDPSSVVQYNPLVYTSFWLEYRIAGARPFLYHLDNLILHGAVTLLLWRVLLRLGLGRAGAWLSAALFALHPVHVETVAWVSERKNLLSVCFYLLSLLAYLKYALADGGRERGGGGEGRARALLALSFLFFAAALLSKAVTVTLPAAIVVLLWYRKGRLAARDCLPLVPMALLGLLMGLLAVWFERHRAGAAGDEFSFTLPERALIAGKAFWFYLSKLLWPVDLMLIYPRWEVDASLWRHYLPLLLALCLLALLWGLRRRLGRAPAAAALFFSLSLAPTLGFVDFYFMLYSFVADHFQYLPSMGPLALAGGTAAAICERRRLPGAFFAGAATLLLLLPLGVGTWRHAGTFSDEETLWRDTLRSNPGAAVAYSNLAVIQARRGETAAAEGNYRRALELWPGYEEARLNLGALLANRGRVQEGLAHFLYVVGKNPDNPIARLNAARALRSLGREGEAAVHFRELRRLLGESAPQE